MYKDAFQNRPLRTERSDKVSEYIKREDVLKSRISVLEHIHGIAHTMFVVAVQDINDVPAADVEPVVRGKWTPNKRHAGFMVCDQCRFGIPINTMVVMECNRRSDEREFCVCAGDVELAYCPNCGAHMERSGSGE